MEGKRMIISIGRQCGSGGHEIVESVVLGAVFPIAIIIIAAMFTYNLCVETKAMDLIKKMLTSVTNDKRMLVLILAWGFGGFMEAVVGYCVGFGVIVCIMSVIL